MASDDPGSAGAGASRDDAAKRRASGGIRAGGVLLTVGLPILLLLGVGYYRFVEAHRADLIRRNYRAAAAASRQLNAEIDGVRRELASQPKAAPAKTDAEAATQAGTRSNTPSKEKSPCGAPPAVKGIWLGDVSLTPVPGRPTLSLDLGGVQSRDVDLKEFSTARFFDLVLLRGIDATRGLMVGRDAAIVFGDFESLVQPVATQSSSGLLPFFSSKEPAADGPATTDRKRTLSDAQHESVTVMYRGDRYYAFCQPISDVAVTGDCSTAMMCGLTPASELDGEAWTMPSSTLFAILVLAIGTLVAWPALKLRLLGARERLEITDVRLLVLSAVLGVGLGTFFVLLLVGHRHLVRALDDDAYVFATQLAVNLQQELRAVDQRLDVVDRLDPREGNPCGAMLPVSTVPITDFAFADATGVTLGSCWLQKDGFEPVPQPPPHVRDRSYFIDLKRGYVWPLDPDGHSRQRAIASIRTKTRGLSTIAVARERADGSVLVGAARLRSAIEPATPPGFGFALIDADGRVQLHSDVTRNLEENLFEEVDAAAMLQAAMAARRLDFVDGSYSGQPYRFLVYPLRAMPWTLVVFRSRTGAEQVRGLVAFRWLVVFSFYLLALLLGLACLAGFAPRYRAPWIWPDDARIHGYWFVSLWQAVVYGCGLAAALTPEIGARSDAQVLVGAPLMSLSAAYVLLADVRRARLFPMAFLVLLFGMLLVTDALWSRGVELPVVILWVVGIGIALACYLDRKLLAWLQLRRPSYVPEAFKRTAEAAATEARENEIRASATLHVAYVTMIVAMLLVAAALPSLVIFRDAYALTLEQFGKRAQIEKLEGIARLNERRHQSLDHSVTLGDSDPGIYDASVSGGRRASAATGSAVDPPARGSDASLEWLECDDIDPICRDVVPLFRRHLVGVMVQSIGRYLPTLQTLVADGAVDGAWQWSDGRGRTLDMSTRDGWTLHSDLPALWDAVASLWCIGLATFLFALLILLVRWTVNRLFLLRRRGELVRSPRPNDDARPWVYVAIFAEDADIPQLRQKPAEVVDLEWSTKDTADVVPAQRKAQPIIIDHLEARLESAKDKNEVLLKRLETLVFGEGSATDGAVVLISEIDPLWFLSLQFNDSESQKSDEHDVIEQFWRWAELFAACHLHREQLPEAPPTPPARGNPQTLETVLQGKTAAWLESRGRMTDAVGWRIWSQSTKLEKLAMAQLAREGFLNPSARDIALRLMERGLVHRTPAFEFFNRQFAAFVMRAEAPGDVDQWEREEGGSWASLRTRLMIGLATVLGFFFVTQREAYSAFFTLLAAVASGIPTILQFGKLLVRGRGSGPTGS